jgi:hypothetical protein
MALTSPGDTPAIEAVLVTGDHWIIITLCGRLDGQSLVVHIFSSSFAGYGDVPRKTMKN